MGLCNRLVPAAEIRAQATALAAEIAACAPLATRAIRRTMRGPVAQAMREAMNAERVVQDQLIRTADFAEGTGAVRERRQPQFRAE
jgi:1,4-dihydroxy-2-naphthoyl-CoA synthase